MEEIKEEQTENIIKEEQPPKEDKLKISRLKANKKYVATHRDKINSLVRDYYNRHKEEEEFINRNREKSKKYYEEHKEQIKEKKRKKREEEKKYKEEMERILGIK